MADNMSAKIYKPLGPIEALGQDERFDLAVYDPTVYSSPEAAMADGALHTVANTQLGRSEVYCFFDGLNAVQKCCGVKVEVVVEVKA